MLKGESNRQWKWSGKEVENKKKNISRNEDIVVELGKKIERDRKLGD